MIAGHSFADVLAGVSQDIPLGTAKEGPLSGTRQLRASHRVSFSWGVAAEAQPHCSCHIASVPGSLNRKPFPPVGLEEGGMLVEGLCDLH